MKSPGCPTKASAAVDRKASNHWVLAGKRLFIEFPGGLAYKHCGITCLEMKGENLFCIIKSDIEHAVLMCLMLEGLHVACASSGAACNMPACTSFEKDMEA